MNIIRAAGLIVGTTVAAAGLAGPAFAAAPATPEPPRTVDSMKAKVDAKAAHITAKLQAMQTKLAAKPKLAAAQSTLQADIAKALADTATWRSQTDAATTKEGVRAAGAAHQAVKADLAKLHADLTAAKGAKKAA
jgi:predicted  nucleic acid-binding Zn-ribbon protein